MCHSILSPTLLDVAATGIPDFGTMMTNAVSMAGFAARMLLRMNELCKELEMVYGPDTAKLNIRIGAHSGPVTGGFLRGKQSRFQLFGDTINGTCTVFAALTINLC